MRWLKRMATWYSGLDPQQPSYWVAKLLGRTQTSTGIVIDQDRALAISAVWCAVNLIAGAIGCMPLIVYRREKTGKERAPDHPAYRLLHQRANPYMDAMSLRETMQGHVLFHGNAYAEIERDNRGQPIALWPIPPNMIDVRLEGESPVYYMQLIKGQNRRIEPANMLHIYGLGYTGTKGYSVIEFAAENLALTAAVEEFGAKFFKNGVYPSGVMETEGVLTQKSLDALKTAFSGDNAGLSNAHRTLILQHGLKWHQIGVSPEAAQFLASRKYNIEDVARWFNVPAYMLQSESTRTRASIEQKADDFVRWGLLPWLRRWENEVNNKLFGENEGEHLFAEFLLESLLRADTKTQAEVNALYLQNGVFSINEVRAMLNMNTIEGGDSHLQPLNLTPVDKPAQPGGIIKPTSPAKVGVDDKAE